MKFLLSRRLCKLIGAVLFCSSMAQAQGIITTVAGSSPNGGFSGDGGPATSAGLFLPRGVALDAAGNLYIADSSNNRVRKVTPGGTITTAAGNGQFGYSGDGGPATSATIVQPYAVALDGAGNLYIADYGNNRIRKVTPGGTISTVAGNGTFGAAGDGGPATSANLNRPYSVAVDTAGNLYIADFGNQRIRKVTPGGIISTVAGNGGTGFSGDGGPAISAQLNSPWGVAVDSAGNLYIADNQNNRIRKVTPGGTISTVAGNGTIGFSGDGGPATSARLSNPRGVLVDSAGNLYIGDSFNHCIRKVTPGGTISTVAGLGGNPGFSGDNGPATSAELTYPEGMALDAAGNLYIADSTNHRVRKVTVAALPSDIIVSPQSLSFSGLVGGASDRQALQISTSGGTIAWSATATLLNGTGWLIASPPSGTATASTPSRLAVEVNLGAFAEAGLYQAVIVVRDTARGASVRVPVAVAVSPARSRLLLSQASFLFRAVEGGTAPSQTLRIFNGGLGSLSWTIPDNLTAPQNWLRFSALSGTASAGRTGASPTTLSVSTAGLSAGVYQALVPVSAPGATNDPQLASVTLHVAPAGTAATPELSSNGLLFVIEQGSITVPVVDLFASNVGGGSVAFQFQVTTETGGNWLSVTPASGTVSSAARSVSIGVDLKGLALGINRARITITFTPGGTREVEVVLVISGDPIILARDLPGAAVCAPQTMDMVISSVGNGSVVPVSFPRPLLTTVVDSCGVAVSDATVVASVEGRTIPLQSVGNGLYSGNWVPERQSASVAMSFTALHSTYSTVQRTVTVSTAAAAGQVSLPAILPDGVVEGAGFTPQRPLAPGGIISIFGSRFAASDNFASRVPLERELGGVSVRVGNETAPLYFAGPSQVNAQMPLGVQAGGSVSVVVNVGGKLTAPQSYLVAPAQPGIFIAGSNGAILDGQSRLITAENPARIGDTLQIYTTGLGETDPPAKTGEAAPAFSRVLLPVTVTVGGVEAPVVYQGLAPGFVGLYQVNVVLPSTVTPGDAVPVVVQQNGIVSNPDLPATIPVR